MSKNEKYGWRHKKTVVSLTGLFVLISPIAYAAGSEDSALDKVKGITATIDKATATIDKAGQNIITELGLAVNGAGSEESTALSAAAEAEAKRCAAGEEGTQGAAIRDAVAIHTSFASVGPDVEKFFDANHDCFAQLNKLYDLSFSIPSLASITNAAQEAVLDYAKQKACSAIKEATSELVSPINSAIDKINNNYGKYLDLNGMANGALSGGLSKLDPELGNIYRNKSPSAGYTIQPFSTAQTTFDRSPVTGGSNSTLATPSFNGMSNQPTYNNKLPQLDELNKRLQSEQMKLPSAQQNLSNMQGQLNRCLSHYGSGGCMSQQQQVQQAQYSLNQIQGNIGTYQNQVSGLSGNRVSAGEMKVETPPAENRQQGQEKPVTSFDRLKNIIAN